jgi:hypothetical protein
VKIGSRIRVLLRVLLNSLRGCGVGITDMRDIFKYFVEMASGTMIFIPSFVNIGSGIRNLFGRICMQTSTDTQTAR